MVIKANLKNFEEIKNLNNEEYLDEFDYECLTKEFYNLKTNKFVKTINMYVPVEMLIKREIDMLSYISENESELFEYHNKILNALENDDISNILTDTLIEQIVEEECLFTYQLNWLSEII